MNAAATSLQKPPGVAAAVAQAMGCLGSAGRGAHASELDSYRIIYKTRRAIAGLLGFSCPERVAFTANATQALNTAILGLLKRGDHVIATDWEHNSVLRPLYRLAREREVRVDFAPADERGGLDYGALESLFRPDTRAVVCTHASNLTGNLLELGHVAELAADHGATLILDAAQTAGCIPLSVDGLGRAVVCFTGHKGLMGPQGTGGLCVAKGVELEPLITGGTGVRSALQAQPEEYPEHLEAGTLNSHGIAGLYAAAEFIRETGVEVIHSHELRLCSSFIRGISGIPGITMYGEPARDRAAVVALNIGGWDPAMAADTLAREYDIAVRAGLHCAPRMHRALGTDKLGAVRFSFGYYNTMDEIDAALYALKEMAGRAMA